jgi:hypothetical protein
MTISYVGSGGSGLEIFFCVVLVNSGHGGNVNVLAGNSIGGVAMMFWREVGPAFGATTTHENFRKISEKFPKNFRKISEKFPKNFRISDF